VSKIGGVFLERRTAGGFVRGAARFAFRGVDSVSSTHTIAQRLPDIPRWVEARSLLLSGDGEVFGLDETSELALAVRDPSTGSVFVVGHPSQAAVRDAVSGIMHDGCLVAAPELAPWLVEVLPGWTGTRAILHLLREPARLPAVTADVALLDPDTIDRLPISRQLRRELHIGAEDSPIAAAFVNGQPVSFCYAGSVTESLWDVSIDTLPDHRRRGHAGRCAAYMIRHMETDGRQPVWGAVEENPASWLLAQKIGFAPVDEIALFEPPSTSPA
jgi:GNAT superfamily N-acetyltransferase